MNFREPLVEFLKIDLPGTECMSTRPGPELSELLSRFGNLTININIATSPGPVPGSSSVCCSAGSCASTPASESRGFSTASPCSRGSCRVP